VKSFVPILSLSLSSKGWESICPDDGQVDEFMLLLLGLWRVGFIVGLEVR
jgi:hypothetical protein